MRGAQGVLINITGGFDMTLFELDEAANEIRAQVDPDANIILGSTFDPELEGHVRVSVVAAGLDADGDILHAAPSKDELLARAAGDAGETPVVVTSAGTFTTRQETPEDASRQDKDLRDHRPDFAGRPLPAAHVDPSEGGDEIAADTVLGRNPKPAPAPGGETSGFVNLFGWRRGLGDNDDAPEQAESDALIASPDDHPEPAPFDDADLEIPAFLRRSANN